VLTFQAIILGELVKNVRGELERRVNFDLKP
jgi:hypothetical protein